MPTIIQIPQYIVDDNNEQGQSTASYRWTGQSSKTSGESLVILEESVEYASKQLRKPETCNQLDFGFTRILTDYAQKSPQILDEVIGWG